MAQPQWATPQRQQRLVQLFLAYKGRCLKGHARCRKGEHYLHTYLKAETVASRGRVGRAPYYRSVPTPVKLPATGKLDKLPVAQIMPPEHQHIPGDTMQERVPVEIRYPVRQVPVQHTELSDLYGVAEENAIESWKADDRKHRTLDWERVQQPTPTGESGIFGVFHQVGRAGSYDPIDVEKHVSNRPRYYHLGCSVHKLRRIASVRIPGTNIILKVDVTESIQLQEMSRGKRQRLRRQGKQLKTELQLIEGAVTTWWAR